MTLIDASKLLAEVELAIEDYDSALKYAQQALTLAQEIEQQEYEAIAHRVLGQIYRAEGKMAEARMELITSETMLADSGNKLEWGKSLYELAVLLKQLADSAWKNHLQQAIDIFDELAVETELAKAQAELTD